MEAADAVEEFHQLRRIRRKGRRAGRDFGVLVSGQEALGEADDLDPFAVGLLQALDDLGEVALEVAGHGLELTMADAHEYLLLVGLPACHS